MYNKTDVRRVNGYGYVMNGLLTALLLIPAIVGLSVGTYNYIKILKVENTDEEKIKLQKVSSIALNSLAYGVIVSVCITILNY